MARKMTVKDIEPINDTPRFMICPKCNKKYKADQFVKSSRFPGGYIPICKECMYEMTINAEGLDRQGLISFCQYVNLPFVQNDFEDAKSYPAEMAAERPASSTSELSVSNAE